MKFHNDTFENVEFESRMQAWESWNKTIQTLTLGEILSKNGFSEGTSTNGFPQIQWGNPDGPVMLAKTDWDHPYAALNALGHIGKYRVLEHRFHEAYFDPRVNADDIAVKFNPDSGLYEFISWKNETLVSSTLNIEKLESEKLVGKRNRMINKHRALDQWLQCKKRGGFFTIVLFSEELLMRYHKMREFFEKPFSEYLEYTRDRGEEANTRRNLFRNMNTYTPSIPTDPEAKELVALLEAATDPVDVYFKTQTSDGWQVYKYVPGNSASTLFLNGVLRSGNVKFALEV